LRPASLAANQQQHQLPRCHTHPHPRGHDTHPSTKQNHTKSHQHLVTSPSTHPLVSARTHHRRDRNQISFSSPTAAQPQPTAAPAQLSIRMWSTGQAHKRIANPTPTGTATLPPTDRRRPVARRSHGGPARGGGTRRPAGAGPAVHAGGPSPPTRAAHHRR